MLKHFKLLHTFLPLRELPLKIGGGGGGGGGGGWSPDFQIFQILKSNWIDTMIWYIYLFI